MALHKFPKPKTFHVDYCGCTAAALLLNESSIREAINLVRQSKSKREFVKTKLSVSRDGIKIVYEDEQNYSTFVPASMIAGSTTSKSSHDTVGVVYISPLTGRHYPAFVHAYRCDSSRAAQKLLIRFRAFIFLDDHRSQVLRFERELLQHSLLTIDRNNSSKIPSQSPKTTTLESNQTNTGLSSSSGSSSSRPDRIDPVKSITQELQKKIDSQEPLLFPPKDYDTVHAHHGNIQRAQAWKSTEPSIVGYVPIDPDNQRPRQRPTLTNHDSSNNKSSRDGIKISDNSSNSFENPERTRFSSQRSDTSVDPVETVSLAFGFLKDETDSIMTDNDGNIEPLEIEQPDKSAVFRFRPPPITAITKKLFTRSNNYELQNDLNAYYNNTRYHQQQQLQKPNEVRARSETNLHIQPPHGIHLSPRYESRLANGSGAPIPTNPLWMSTSPTTVGSQPNLLTNHSPTLQAPLYRMLSPPIERRMAPIPLQHPLYAAHPNTKSSVTYYQRESPQKRYEQSIPSAYISKQQTPPFKYFDTNEFILRASNGNLLNNYQQPARPLSGPSRDHIFQSNNVNTNSNTMLDVYY
ncbi:unnamed protein product [Adineta ricciae]|uniref:PID domain-containing protein n=1 Tax=Adineta ricciae TaxID=249248 RepID=A0A814Z3K4_ADIRI|nr:unnamed protein product [Adineta ricciae]